MRSLRSVPDSRTDYTLRFAPMKPINAISISVGLLVFVWTFATLGYLEPKVITWITFLTWASFMPLAPARKELRRASLAGWSVC